MTTFQTSVFNTILASLIIGSAMIGHALIIRDDSKTPRVVYQGLEEISDQALQSAIEEKLSQIFKKQVSVKYMLRVPAEGKINLTYTISETVGEREMTLEEQWNDQMSMAQYHGMVPAQQGTYLINISQLNTKKYDLK